MLRCRIWSTYLSALISKVKRYPAPNIQNFARMNIVDWSKRELATEIPGERDVKLIEPSWSGECIFEIGLHGVVPLPLFL
jgi:hypothetical protein